MTQKSIERCNAAMKQWLKRGQLRYFIQLDIDWLMAFNDWFGHPKGDALISTVFRCLKELSNQKDCAVFHLGSDEFGILVPQTCDTKIGETFRKAIFDLAIPAYHPEANVGDRVTVSVGVVDVNSTKCKTLDDLLCLADNAIHAAKSNGRNCVHISNWL